MNTSAALRLLAAAEDDAVLASWAAVFDEYKMSPECDVSPYDCWEVLQSFLSSGVLSGPEYNNVNLRSAFFAGARPSTNQIQLVLDRLKLLRANSDFHQESSTMSNAKPPMAAFSNESSLTRGAERAPELPARAPRPGLANRSAHPGLSAFQPDREVLAHPREFGALTQAPPAAQQSPSGDLTCRQVDANLYQQGDINVQLLCCGLQVATMLEEAMDYEDQDLGGEYPMHEYIFHGECTKCGTLFHSSMSKPGPRDY